MINDFTVKKNRRTTITIITTTYSGVNKYIYNYFYYIQC